MAQWTADKWSSFGIPSSLAEYWVLLNYPVSQSVSLDLSNGSSYSAVLIEEPLSQDETTSYPSSVPAFHGLSWSGEESAEYVYVGRGQQVGFDRLKELGVPLAGRIALSKYGGPFRGLKVKNAQKNDMKAIVIFTDPGDDGNVTEANVYEPYPAGPARNPTSIQRGSDPWIPSVPISWKDAVPLLAALDGFGVPGDQVNRSRWVGGLNVTYSTGPSPDATLSLSNHMDDTVAPIWNAVGIITGTDPDYTLVIGNHRDQAWVIGGAADPNSGSAIMIELSKAFGRLLSTGWKPKRNIVLCSWDAEEYGLYGSTEWVEEYIPWLAQTSVAYLNIDGAVSGPLPDFSSTPELHNITQDIMKKVLWPHVGSGELNSTMYEAWLDSTGGDIGVLGSGSDYTAFLHNGISSLNVGAGGGPNDAIYHYHSNYDSYHWMTAYGDPADDPIIPFDLPNFTTELRAYLVELRATVLDAGVELDVEPLAAAITTFETSAKGIASAAAEGSMTGDKTLVDQVNSKYRDFQRGFTSQGGLPDRGFFRHVVFAPGIDTGYAAVVHPGVTEAVEAGNVSLAESELHRTIAAIEAAAAILNA
ncbi:hypothetical protein diail_6727 [Diaporthe ilicicola]|nr:hypothetical protein diail_6727 [Diaporthe ilicicola]